MILAIDPGPEKSALVLFDESSRRVVNAIPDWSNESLLMYLRQERATKQPLAVEWIESFGMAVGKSVFETCYWIGRFVEAYGAESTYRISRKEVKLNLCSSMRAKDANIRQALIDKLGPVGKSKNRGPLYGVKSHAWSALAIAVTWAETKGKR